MDDKGPILFPKWVKAHESRIFRKKIEGLPEAVSVQGFDQCHVNRANGEVTVLVQSENEENEATSAAKEPEVIEPVEPVVLIEPAQTEGK